MTYSDAVNYLFESAPLFQNVGKDAYKEGLANTLALDEHFAHPHQSFKTIHVAGTNGKGSCSHLLAAVLQAAGYRVGLYTSPHLVDFRERIRVNGERISEDYVVDFVESERAFFEPLHPSFFELTTALAFKYFAEQKVDVAVIEVGLGGRLDCTNIIMPELCVITNISHDHTQFLGDTLAKIATEKAGIMKPGVPVVVGETLPETLPVFEQTAHEVGARLSLAEHYASPLVENVECELKGIYQQKNRRTVLCALSLLPASWNILEEHIREGFAHVCSLTGLMGRWQRVGERPLVICDTGHNVGGWEYLSRQIPTIPCRRLHMVFGMVNDKDISGVLRLLPKDAVYYYTKASVRRAMPEIEIAALAQQFGLPSGNTFPTVAEAFRAAHSAASPDDAIFVGGSSFVVADFLAAEYGRT